MQPLPYGTHLTDKSNLAERISHTTRVVPPPPSSVNNCAAPPSWASKDSTLIMYWFPLCIYRRKRARTWISTSMEWVGGGGKDGSCGKSNGGRQTRVHADSCFFSFFFLCGANGAMKEMKQRITPYYFLEIYIQAKV